MFGICMKILHIYTTKKLCSVDLISALIMQWNFVKIYMTFDQ
jgi:hypothetical protein